MCVPVVSQFRLKRLTMLYSSFYNFHLDKIVGNFSIVCLLCQVRAKSGLRKEIFFFEA